MPQILFNPSSLLSLSQNQVSRPHGINGCCGKIDAKVLPNRLHLIYDIPISNKCVKVHYRWCLASFNAHPTASGFPRNIGGSKGTEFAEYCRRNTCNRQILGKIYQLHKFFMKNMYKKIKAQAKIDFLNNNRVFGLWFY